MRQIFLTEPLKILVLSRDYEKKLRNN